MNTKKKEKICKNCGNEFEGHGNRKYCSEKCAFDTAGYLIDDQTDCWNWQGNKDNNGYGMFFFNNKTFKAHRFSCELVHGPAPEGKPFVLHACDNPACINPNHLRFGSPQENMDDKVERNRQPKGEKHGIAKLKDEDVIDIKAKLKSYAYGDYKKLAKEYNVVLSTIRNIHNGKTWNHI